MNDDRDALRHELEMRPTDELVSILRNRDEEEWRPEVFDIVAVILSARGLSPMRIAALGPEPGHEEDAPDARDPDARDLVTVGRYFSPMEAQVHRMALEQIGIQVWVFDETVSAGYGFAAGVRVQVRVEDLEPARAVLAEAGMSGGASPPAPARAPEPAGTPGRVEPPAPPGTASAETRPETDEPPPAAPAAYDSLAAAPPRLRWLEVTPGLYDLRADERWFGRLQFKRLPPPRALGETADGRWRFEPMGFLGNKIGVLEPGSAREIAVIAVSGADEGALFASGSRERLTALTWSAHDRAWSSPDDWLIRFFPGGESMADAYKFQYDVEVHESVRGLPELSLLVCLGWYFLVSTRHPHRTRFAF